MPFDFDEIISRDGTAAVASESYRDFLLADVADADLPAPDADLVSLWVADMDLASPDVALDAIRARLERRILGYTRADDAAYLDAFLGWCARRYDWTPAADHVCIGRGVVPALIDLVAILSEPGDRVATLTPAYHWFEEAPETHGLDIVTVALQIDDGHARLDLDRLDTALADPAVTLLLFCHPHNPVGRMWTEHELGAVANRCRAHGVRIISDEVHADLLRTGRRHTPFASIAPDDGIITCLAPSKTFNLAGLRFCNVVIAEEAEREAFVAQNPAFTNPLSLAAATGVYRDGDAWLDALRSHLDHNLDLVAATLAARLPNARFAVPEATYLAWIDLGPHVDGIDDLSAFFATQAHVLVEGPHKFVADAEGCIRLNVACPTAKVVDALDRMIDALDRRAAGG
ncbi:MAG: aminotransferase class I/II-fold pyridoxal phosphate-dependent enzyme [Actinomycetota bacterium]